MGPNLVTCRTRELDSKHWIVKILYPTFFFFPDQTGGGPTNTVYWQSKALIKKGVKVTIVTTSHGITNLPLDTWLETDYGQVIYLKTAHPKWSLRLVLYSFQQLHKVDIVHLNSFFYPPALFIALYALILNKKIVWSPRGELAQEALAFGSRLKSFVLFIIKSFRKKIVFHTTSIEELEILRGRLGRDTQTLLIPNLMEIPKIQQRVKDKHQDPFLLFIGRIHPIKGIENLIMALSMSTLFKKNNFTLKIAGGGESTYIQHLKQVTTYHKIDNKIEWIGHIDGENKTQILNTAYATLLPSFSENFGVVVIESLAQYTPVIASKNTPWSILEKYNAGFWVENTAEKLAEFINKIIALPPTNYNEMCDNARQLVEDEFDVERKINIWIEAYSKIIT